MGHVRHPGTTMTLCLGSSMPPLSTGTSPSLGPKQATSTAQVETKTETGTKAHILAAEPAGRCSQPWEPSPLLAEVPPSQMKPRPSEQDTSCFLVFPRELVGAG